MSGDTVRRAWLAALQVGMGIALVHGLVNTLVGNGPWGVAWTAAGLALGAHLRLERMDRARADVPPPTGSTRPLDARCEDYDG